MKESLEMQLADVRAMRAMWVSGESDHGIADECKTHKTHQHEPVCCRNKLSLALFFSLFLFFNKMEFFEIRFSYDEASLLVHVPSALRENHRNTGTTYNGCVYLGILK